MHVVFFERDQVELLDNWNPSGLRGTGSVDFVVDDVFVPDGRWTVLGVSKRQIDRHCFGFRFWLLRISGSHGATWNRKARD